MAYAQRWRANANSAHSRASEKLQNGTSSSMSADLPAPASAGLRSRDMLGPLEPNSSPLSALAPPPPPRVSSMVSDELKPCSTTSVEYLSWPSLSVHLRVCRAPSRYTFKLFFRYCSTIL